jgi:hypothetical protein
MAHIQEPDIISLDDYDHETLDNKGDTEAPVNYPAHEDYMDMIENRNKT